MEGLLNLDREILLFINGLHNPWLDSLMVLISGKLTWVPVYVAVLVLLFKKLGWRNALVSVLVCVLVVVAADQLSSSLLKPLVGRLRPCHEPGLDGLLHLVDGKCGGQFGFVSSHASNFAGMGIFIWAVLFRNSKSKLALAMIPFALVGYSRIYLGVHYPLDVVCGGALGIAAGLSGAAVYRLVSAQLPKVIHKPKTQ